MNSSELLGAFRDEVVDTAKPYLWKDPEVFRYMDDAYRMFVRLVGGIADFTSDVASAAIVAGDPLGVLDASVLRIMRAQRRSDNGEIKIINFTDLDRLSRGDYGQVKQLQLNDEPGPVRYGVIGMQRGIVRWLQVPMVDDVADLQVYRLPLVRIDDFEQTLDEVDEDHHLSLLHWMKYRAYSKQDADSFDGKRALVEKQAFEDYCRFVRAEVERYKYKNREVAYGGI